MYASVRMYVCMFNKILLGQRLLSFDFAIDGGPIVFVSNYI